MTATDTALPGTDAWREERRSGIGGSDVAAIVGESRWATPLDVYVSKVSTHPEELRDLDERRAMAMEAGTRLEPVVCDWVCELEGLNSARFTAIVRRDDHPWMIANPDRLVYTPAAPDTPGVLEAKAPGYRMRDDWDDDQVSVAALLQTQWYLGVLGWEWAIIGALIGGQDLRWQRVERHDELIGMLRQRAGEFWHDHVLKRRPPPATGRDVKILEAAYDVTADSMRSLEQLPPAVAGEIIELVQHYRRLRRLEREIGDRKDQTKARLAELLGQHDVEAVTYRPDPAKLREVNLVSWRPQHQVRVDVKALREERPDVARAFEREQEGRRLLVTTRKELGL